MGADREFKHFCKLCNRSFPCGRSLGGHMRSHLFNSQAEAGENLKKINLKKAGRRNYDMDKFLGAGVSDGYSLRKNPKKASRLDEFSGEDRFCRECGRSFQSWKALFGHMKCHSTETERVSSNLEFDSQSDNEIAAANRGKRSRRRQTRYMAAETSSSLSFANATAAAAAASSSVSDHNDQEQEEVALCLMMLSKDVGGFHSTTESSDNNCMPKQAPSLVPKSYFSKAVEAIPSICMGSEMVRLTEFHSRKLELSDMESGYLKFEGSNTEFSDSAVKMNKNNEKSQHDDRFGSSSNNQPQFISSKLNSDQRKFHELCNGELRSNSLRRSTPKELNSEAYESKGKRSKFQCNSCPKIFHSYQALGGHKASHKRTKGCLASKTENSENSNETEISNDPTFESKSTATVIEMENQQESDIHMGYEKKNRKHHQCSICFKIFSSGQALGGHKRSHLISGSEPRNKLPQTTSIQKAKAEKRDFLDLNLPAPVDEEGSSHLGSLEPWWVGGSHSHEQALVGLI